MSVKNNPPFMPPPTPGPAVRQQSKPTSEQFNLIRTNSDLATSLGMKSVKMLTWLGKTKSAHYSKLFIRKKGKNSKLRVLHNPDQPMRIVQYKILTKILNSISVPEYIYAFEKEKNIPLMAAKHVQQQIVINIDIKDFFHSIKQSVLFDMFKRYGFAEKPARTLSEICTFKAFVPQGALTSPKISNIIAATTFGPPVKKFCEEQDLVLTIYADDITVSSKKTDVNPGMVISALSAIIAGFGFRANTAKTKVMRKHNRQYVCGVVVNEKTNMLRKERLRLRAMVHNLAVNGAEIEANKTTTTPDNFINVLRGRINWFKQLNESKGTQLMSKFNEALARWKINTEAALIQPSSSEAIVELESNSSMGDAGDLAIA